MDIPNFPAHNQSWGKRGGGIISVTYCLKCKDKVHLRYNELSEKVTAELTSRKHVGTLT